MFCRCSRYFGIGQRKVQIVGIQRAREWDLAQEAVYDHMCSVYQGGTLKRLTTTSA